MTSAILRLGTRYTRQTTDKFAWYGGLAYDYELDGEATGRADGVPIRAVETKGGSMVAELGVKLRQSEKSPWELDLGLHGSVGKRQGIGGAVKVEFWF